MKNPSTSQMPSLSPINYGIVQIQQRRSLSVRVHWRRVRQEDYNNEKIEVCTK